MAPEERKQVLYLLGPVGGGKSSLAERLKLLMEKEPIYVLKAGDEISPVFESPLGLFDPVTLGAELDRQGAHEALDGGLGASQQAVAGHGLERIHARDRHDAAGASAHER